MLSGWYGIKQKVGNLCAEAREPCRQPAGLGNSICQDDYIKVKVVHVFIYHYFLTSAKSNGLQKCLQMVDVASFARNKRSLHLFATSIERNA